MTSLSVLEGEIRGCARCALHTTRTQAVVGHGPEDAAIMVVGEAPGQVEDHLGIPFAGPSGRVLDQWLEGVGGREKVRVVNTVRCRPPGNRNPETGEREACSDFLRREIRLVKPRLILAVGKVAAEVLTGKKRSMALFRVGDWLYTDGELEIPVACVWHPAYALRVGKRIHDEAKAAMASIERSNSPMARHVWPC